MKKTILFISAFTLLLISGNTFAQEERTLSNSQEMKSIQKEVNVEEKNGVKTLTITTTTNGVVEKEVYTGAEADTKMAELKNEMEVSGDEKEIEMKVEVVDGVTYMKIKTIENGEVTIEEYKGEAAEQKLKELGVEETPAKGKKIIIKEEKKIEKSNM